MLKCPNVDHKKALVALDLLLREARSPETPLLVELARLILENNYLSSKFSPGIFHQEFGIAMGKPFALTIANAFMYYHEKDIVEQYSNYLLVYRYFIDDIFAIWAGPKDIVPLKSKLTLKTQPRASMLETFEDRETRLSRICKNSKGF